ncbi:MAG: hypothetical protein LBU62_04325 [Bacteroidales bacterium]|jgi:hypothetical protein|nr:hypothetical protein [Bacteroidales bacterium]
MKNIGKIALGGLILACLLASCGSSSKYPKQKKSRKRGAPCDCPTFGQQSPAKAYYIAYVS